MYRTGKGRSRRIISQRTAHLAADAEWFPKRLLCIRRVKVIVLRAVGPRPLENRIGASRVILNELRGVVNFPMSNQPTVLPLVMSPNLTSSKSIRTGRIPFSESSAFCLTIFTAYKGELTPKSWGNHTFRLTNIITSLACITVPCMLGF